MPLRLVALSLLLGTQLPAGEPAFGKQPNIIVILTDDQGYGDVSCHGNPLIKTPNMDRLHDEGTRFTRFFVSPTCAPTRSALLTGRHEFANGVTHTILERERLNPTSTTIAQVLKGAGYATGIFGKWHLGDEAEYRPDRFGFDEVFIHGGGGIGQHYPGSCGDAPGNTYFSPYILHNNRFEKTDGYCTDVFFAQAKRWIDDKRGKQPFFAWIATNAPHKPLQVRPEDEARYADTATPEEAKFYGMIANVDDNIGKLLDQLDRWEIARDTLVILMNDNGGTVGCKRFNAGMRGTKGSPWLGGIRAMSFWRWPGIIKPAESKNLAAHIDLMPTLAAIAGVDLNESMQKQVEGRSLVPLLREPTAAWPERIFFTHVGRWPKGADVAKHQYDQCSVLDGRWHLVNTAKTGKAWQLYDLTSDFSELQDVAAQHPAEVARLAAAYGKWWEAMVPRMINELAVGPQENPFWTLFREQFGTDSFNEMTKKSRNAKDVQ